MRRAAALDVTVSTLDRMASGTVAALGDPTIVQLAREIVRGRERDAAAQASALLSWVRRSIAYIPDPVGVELVQTPRETLRREAGDCDDMAALLAALAGAVGVPGAFVAVATRPELGGVPDHVYAELLCAGQWLGADPTVPGVPLGWRPPEHGGVRAEVRY